MVMVMLMINNEVFMKVIFSDRAYSSVMQETYEFSEQMKESGGILLGRRFSSTIYVMENISPGYNAIHNIHFFEYDTKFVQYQANKISALYDYEIELLGYWHIHINSSNSFSKSDIELNMKYLRILNKPIISGIMLLNHEKSEFCLKYLDYNSEETIEYKCGDYLIPNELFKLSVGKIVY